MALGTPVRERDHALGPRLRPAHRLPEPLREPADEQLLRPEVRLDAEAAADVGRDDAEVAELHAERAGEAELVLVRHLRREPRRQAAVFSDLGRRGAHLERAAGHARTDERVRDDHIAAVEERLVRLGRAHVDGDVRADVREEQQLVLQCLVRIDDRGQRVVVDHHQLGGVGARRPVVRDHDRDDLTDEADDVLRDRRAQHARLDQGDRRRRDRRDVDVGARQHLHARKVCCGRGVDARDLRVRERGADESERDCALERQVLDVRPLAAEEAAVLLAENAVPEDAHGPEPNWPEPARQRRTTLLTAPPRPSDGATRSRARCQRPAARPRRSSPRSATGTAPSARSTGTSRRVPSRA